MSKGYSKYVCALCKALFSDQELQTCTLTGAPSNFTKKQSSEEPHKKKQLPQDVVKDIIGNAEDHLFLIFVLMIMKIILLFVFQNMSWLSLESLKQP